MKNAIRRMLPKKIRQMMSMSYRQQWYEIRSSLWVLPAIYIMLAAVLSAVAYWAEFGLQPAFNSLPVFSTEYSLTQTMYSTMLSGVLTLNAFTFNSILVVLTSFSGQFTPRVLFNFIADRKTQHSIGIFNLCFFFLLFVFFFLDSSMSEYVIFPISGVVVTSVSVINFILFINHATRWMQVSSITTSMKEESQLRILNTLVYDLEPYRPQDPNRVFRENTHGGAHVVASERTGFLQVVDFGKLIREARKDGIVIQMERRVGDFVMEGITLFKYWKTDSSADMAINEQKFRQFLYLGHSKTEVQDLEFGIRKLTEIAIKSIGNDEPMTAQDAIYQLTDLLFSISKVTKFTPYLTDEDETLRLIMQDEEFSFYVYSAFSHIASYAENDPVVTNSLLEALVILSKALNTKDRNCCWHYGKVIARGFTGQFKYDYDQLKFVNNIEALSENSEDEEPFQSFVRDFIDRGVIQEKHIPERQYKD